MKYQEYKDLAPIDKLENDTEYMNVLDWALKNPKIKNIALAGPYGSGKSSIIDSYLKRDQERNENFVYKKLGKSLSETSLKISMATFIQGQADAGNRIPLDENEIEEGILKQLFYKVKYKKIPHSRYRKLHVKNFKIIFLIVAIIIAILTIFSPKVLPYIWNRIVGIVMFFHLPEYSSAILLLSLWGGVSFIISRFWYLSSNRYFIKEITLPSNAKITADNSFSDSVFNKNLDEIMYFFEATKYRTVFFEDLDRFENRKIFVHLRELNNLLNNDESIKDKPIVFIYAVQDDIFTKEDRTKFFDFIIPVIPIINSTNSGEMLIERIEESRKNEIIHNISQGFILDVSPYISDMRILRNIYNEFVLYKNILKKSQDLTLSDEQMMAIIIFKNLYPSDFADIQAEKGIIKKAFESKNDFIQKEKERIQDEIDNFSEVISKASTDHLKSVRELKAAMLVEMSDHLGFVTRFERGYSTIISAVEIMNDSFDMCELEQMQCDKVRYTSFDGNNTSTNIENFKEKVIPYIKRWNYLNEIEKQGMEKLQENLRELKQRQHSLSCKTIADVLSDCDEFVFEEEIAQNKLLVFLLRKGYIDEKYATYINYFKGKSITTGDMNFILSVKNREPKSFDYVLSKTANVIQRLQDYEFEQKAIYNFSLMEQLLAEDGEKIKRNIFIQQLSDESEQSWNFVDEFIDKTEYKEKFLRLIASTWEGLWEYISGLSTLQYERQLYYLSLIISVLDLETVKKLNRNSSIKIYIESHADILQKLSTSISYKRLCLVLDSLNVSFEVQEIDNVPNKVLDFVFDRHLYKLTPKMIYNVVSYKNRLLVDRLETQPYTTVIDLGYGKLIDYINWNFEYYIENNILDKQFLKDQVDVIIDMLSKILKNPKFCEELIKREQFLVEDINKFLAEYIESNKEDVKVIWDILLSNGKIKPTWENMMSYWTHFSFSNTLAEYITQETQKLESVDAACCTDQFIQEFIERDLEGQVYSQLLPILRMKDFNINFETLSEDMLSLMIEIKYFDFTIARYNYLNMQHPILAITYIEKNQEEFLEQVNEVTMTNELLNELLSNKSIEFVTKSKLVDCFADKYMSQDIVSCITNDNYKITKSCFENAWQYADSKQKKQLFMRNFELLGVDDLETYFGDLGGQFEEFASRIYRHDAHLPETEENFRLGEYLKKVEYITSYESVKRDSFDEVLGFQKNKKMIKYRIKQKR